MIYLDSAATSLQKAACGRPRLLLRHLTLCQSGPRWSQAGHGRSSSGLACREAAARLFQVPKPEQVVFTNNATHGLNIAIKALVRPGGTVVISGYEHNAVTRPLHAIPDVTVRVAAGQLFRPEDRGGIPKGPDPGGDCGCIHPCIQCVWNDPPHPGAGRLCRERGSLHPGRVPVSGLPPGPSGGTGGSLHRHAGPQGAVRPPGDRSSALRTDPRHLCWRGGTGSESIRQEMPDFLPDRLEAGTHNIAGIAGLLEGLRFVEKQGVQSIGSHEQAPDRPDGGSLSPNSRGWRCSGAKTPASRPGVLSFRVSGMDCEELGGGAGPRTSPCVPGSTAPRWPTGQLGTLETGTVRASVSAFNVPQEIPRLSGELRQILSEKAVRPMGVKCQRS